MPSPHGNARARGFTLVEVLVALFIMALMAGLAWRGLDGVVRGRDAGRDAIDRTMRLTTLLSQWQTDLQSLHQNNVVPSVLAFDGRALRLTRLSDGGVQLVAWWLDGDSWQRWTSVPTTRAGDLQQAWLRSQQLQRKDPANVTLARRRERLAGLLLPRQRLDQRAVQRRPRGGTPGAGASAPGGRPCGHGRTAAVGRAAGADHRRQDADARHRRGAAVMTPHRAQRGAALLIAMLILTLVATLAAAMVWHQQRAIEVEAADRAGTQADAMLRAIVDTSRFFIRTLPAGTPLVNGIGISQELKDMRLADLLAVDRDNNLDSTLEAFFSAQITDAQGRYNLRRLAGDDGKPIARGSGGPAPPVRSRRAAGGHRRPAGQRPGHGLVGTGRRGPAAAGAPGPAAWVGLDTNTIELLRPHVTILPTRTPVNANNASAASLVAAIDGLDAPANAQVLLSRRPPTGWRDMAALRTLLPESMTVDDGRVSVHTRYYDLRGSVRLGDRERIEQWLLESRTDRGNEVLVLLPPALQRAGGCYVESRGTRPQGCFAGGDNTVRPGHPSLHAASASRLVSL
jgi:general secretion pathway protein K